MAFYFKPEEPAQAGIRRLVFEQIDKAIDEVGDLDLDRAEAVHQVRKRCKKVRAILRLARASIGDDVYRAENVWFRDTARELSATRDATAAIESFDLLMEALEGQMDTAQFAPIRHAMVTRSREMGASEDFVASRLNFAVRRLSVARERAAEWAFTIEGFDGIAPGLAKVYDRGRREMAQVRREPTDTALHDLRKRVKYHAFHIRLFAPTWPALLDAARDQTMELAEAIGADHDLVVLRAMATGEGALVRAVADPQLLQQFVMLMDRRRVDLQRGIFELGTLVFAEPPETLVSRLRGYWAAWRQNSRTRPRAA